MKIIKQPENADELLKILIHEDVTITLTVPSNGFDYELSQNSGYDLGKLSQRDIEKMISKVFSDLGVVINFK